MRLPIFLSICNTSKRFLISIYGFTHFFFFADKNNSSTYDAAVINVVNRSLILDDSLDTRPIDSTELYNDNDNSMLTVDYSSVRIMPAIERIRQHTIPSYQVTHVYPNSVSLKQTRFPAAPSGMRLFQEWCKIR